MAGERQLTELEGAVLMEIALRGNDTAYKVRRAFQLSPSVQWRGSAGAVSPAIRRLTEGGLVIAEPHPTRRGQKLSLSTSGDDALDRWASDVDLACGVGFDPFRLRAGAWQRIPQPRRSKLYTALLEGLERSITEQEHRPDSVDTLPEPHELALELLKGRIRWLKRRIDQG